MQAIEKLVEIAKESPQPTEILDLIKQIQIYINPKTKPEIIKLTELNMTYVNLIHYIPQSKIPKLTQAVQEIFTYLKNKDTDLHQTT